VSIQIQQAQNTIRPKQASKQDSDRDAVMSKLISAIKTLLQELMKESKKSGNDDLDASPDARSNVKPPAGDCGNNMPGEPSNEAGRQSVSPSGGQSKQSNNPTNTAPGNSPAGSGSASNGPPNDAGNSTGTQDAGKTGGMTGPAGGKYDALIEEKAKKHGVDPDFLKIIVAKESQGNPNAESSAGAVGLCQLKPETAKKYAGREVSKDELKSDVALNLDCAAAYLADLSKMKGGKLDDVAGSYNQGENSNWREIPESQEYVKTVMQSYENKTLPTWG
jgi:Transglycosylase SLT domain